jgi:hypothetical protein
VSGEPGSLGHDFSVLESSFAIKVVAAVAKTPCT